MNYLSDNRVVSATKIEKALNKGNLDGVRRLAKFVCCRSVNPGQVFDACEEQRLQFVIMGFNSDRTR